MIRHFPGRVCYHPVMEKRKPYFGLVVSGLASGSLYLLLYLYRVELMASFSRTDGWYPALPILAAFVFSFAHGAFTGCFWEVLGVTPRKKADK